MSRNFIFLLKALIFLSCSKNEPESGINLTGTWIGEGYICTGIVYSETISISHNKSTGEVMATKITGDPCVPAGNITFTGNYDGKADSFQATYTNGTPTNPASGKNISKITVKNSGLMESSIDLGVVFKKQ